jgi:hypothetical protein
MQNTVVHHFLGILHFHDFQPRIQAVACNKRMDVTFAQWHKAFCQEMFD